MKTAVTKQNGSNLSKISPVSFCLRFINESCEWNKKISKNVKRLSLKELKKKTEVAEEDGFSFVVSLHDGKLINATDLGKYLEYPEDTLEQQHFEDILYYEDHITFTEHLLQGLKTCCSNKRIDHGNLGPNTFFGRIKKFHTVQDGCVDLDQNVTYLPFKIYLHIYELTEKDLSVEKTTGTLCVSAYAIPILSAYTAPEERFSMTCFSTRHSARCEFIHVDENVIPYTGYLPQDMTGHSIFDFYHIDDMPLMKDIYGLVVKERGSTFRSHPYRFKIQNGCYILLETEWSCFVDPWSHHLEFVVGHHRILKGPDNADIFVPSKEEINLPEEILKASEKIRLEIKVVLSEVDSNSVMGDISPYKDGNDSSLSSDYLSPNVQQIYLEGNINRFFASDPQTYPNERDESNKDEKFYQHSQSSTSGSGEKSSTSGSGENSGSISPSKRQQESPTNSENCKANNPQASIDISIDSGYGKGNQGKNSSPGTSQEGSPNDETWLKTMKQSKNTGLFQTFQPLTEESLSAHNRINHKQFKQHRKNKTSLGKRSWKSNYVQDEDSPKRRKGSNRQKLKRSISTQTAGRSAGAQQNGMPGSFDFSHMDASGAMTAPFFIPVMLMGGFPNTPNPQAFWPFGSSPTFNMQPTNEPFKFSNNPNDSAGYTQPTTPTFTNRGNSNHMSGFRNCSFPFTNVMAENQKCAPQQVIRGKCKIPNKANFKKTDFAGSDGIQSQQNISDSMESEDSPESCSYTRSSSFTSEDNKKEDMECAKDKPLPKSSSNNKVELSTEISFRYQMALPSMEETLKKDREALSKMVQPKLVKEQFRLLQEEAAARNKHKTDAENKDFNMTEDIMLGIPTENNLYYVS